ncbi:hypothetical protein [Leyella stercorea]|uniref:hypothetical protein n=1 Tax=Leyella stercorea TaxID=363265 RepID=UPI00242AEB44|nr:hypothetical protein [Leyella stercorea]
MQNINSCHPHRSTQTSASVGADIRVGRRRHPRRSVQTSASVDADIRIGRYETEKMKICRAEDEDM